MKIKNLTIFFLILTLLAQFIFTTPVLADDDTPLPTPTEEITTSLPPAEEPVVKVTVTPEPATTETTAEETAPAEPTATEILVEGESTPVEETATEAPEEVIPEPAPTDIPLLQELPANTSIVVLDVNGEVLPLATQEAAEVVAVADPMWCPATATTVTADCVNDTVIGTIGSGNLLDKIIAKIAVLGSTDGVIYFTPTYSVNDGSFDGSLSAINFEQNALTLQGGWNGDLTLGSTITLSGSSVFSVPIEIFNWKGNITVKDIVLDFTSIHTGNDIGMYITGSENNIVEIKNVTIKNSRAQGLAVMTKGTVNIDNLIVDGNNQGNNFDANGAYVESKNLIVTNSVFKNTIGEYSDGLTIERRLSSNMTGGEIKILGSTFSGNEGSGLLINTKLAIDLVTIQNSFISNNIGSGAYIELTDTIVNLNNVTSVNNGTDGMLLINSVNMTQYTPNRDITISNSLFNNNAQVGARILAAGNLILNDVTATNQVNGSGLVVNSFGEVILNGGSFSNNAYCGVQIVSPDDVKAIGVTTLNNVACAFDVTSPNFTIAANETAPILVFDRWDATGSQIEFELSCADRSNYFATLPNEDKIQIVCPVTGKAIIKRLNNTAIPGELPVGYTYTSAFSLDILQSGKSIPYISEGGRVNVSFDVPNLEEGVTYTLLYWDNGEWVALKDFMLDENGNPREFNLHPNDPRMVLSGLKLVFEDGAPRLELSTNFPGIFVLVQR